MNKYLREFIEETSELLDQADADLLALEKEPEQEELVKNLFRTLHSIKGGCGLLGYSKTEKLTHAGENLLAKVRDNERSFDSDVADALLKVLDATRSVLVQLEQDETEGDEDFFGLIAKLIELRDGEALPGTPPQAAEPSSPASTSASVVGQPPPAPTPRAPEPPKSRTTEAIEAPRQITESSIRVDVGLLDSMMNLVGELVLARNQIVQFTARTEIPSLAPATQSLNLITSELQEQVMKTRMQPIDKAWSKLPRVVRDLAQSCGKKVRIETEGSETELDRTIIEAIKDPLNHIVRNAVDHGIEPPQARQDLGKPAEGVIFLRALHEGGQVNIEISDDGRGISTERIRTKALERGLVSAEELAEFNERETLALIFEPGFSTADEVTTISGRGVGMDVVKANVERIGGSLELDSVPGQGTMLRIKIPLTLAILPALIVTCDGWRFAIPQLNVMELVRIKPDQAGRGIELLKGTPVYRLRDRLLPLVSLREQFHEGTKLDWATTRDWHIVVLFVDGHLFGLVVDECIDTQEIVVKPLGHQLKRAALFAGATIMEDGTVALILDALGLVTTAGLHGDGQTVAVKDEDKADEISDRRLLLFLSDAGTRMAMPLDAVSRLEMFPASEIEEVGRRRVVQYGGEALPLTHIDEALGLAPWKLPTTTEEDAPSISVAVHVADERSVGLVVGRILDIIDAPCDLEVDSRRGGVLDVVVIDGRATQLVELDGLLAEFRRSAFGKKRRRAAAGAEQ